MGRWGGSGPHLSVFGTTAFMLNHRNYYQARRSFLGLTCKMYVGTSHKLKLMFALKIISSLLLYDVDLRLAIGKTIGKAPP